MLVQLGYKEIEVSFPSSSQTDFDFTRKLVTTPNAVPDDVWLQVLSPCRKELIRRTVDSLQGAKKAILHLYLATSPCFQQVVFEMDNARVKALAVECTEYARAITKDDADQTTEWQLEFSPEAFSDSDLDFVIDVCEAVKAAWQPTTQHPIIFNLPATVEVAPPNVYADQIEYFCGRISEREKVCVSVHPHNDRGCAVAAAELAQMAGAERVEGTLFGNGERTGNVDLVTLGLNFYSQGVHPRVDFSNLPAVVDLVEKCTKIPVHVRAPYAGQLVMSAFSGSHQDAIKKGFQKREPGSHWQIPYLPLDPRDIGRSYEAIIRVNSQSGKSGAAWIIQRELGLDLPRGLQVAFSKVIQREAERLGRELQPGEITRLFSQTFYMDEQKPRLSLVDYTITFERSPTPDEECHKSGNKRVFSGVVELDGRRHRIVGVGNGVISALVNAIEPVLFQFHVCEYKEHALGKGSGAKAATFIECSASSSGRREWGVGISEDVVQASLVALLSAVSRVSGRRCGSLYGAEAKH
ncbi:Pyruvate carboxyltransferase [Macrophomina phaseolina MS6]|uniref:2-isopropylmalate synthase n=1 Tax=Macrophomina phaseolina (strain MS6) TaxID=1126212 RepID=K2SC43_MACPH|nr:Pyruvate carboxyltransferase [Macrophomina phaseolina MS6]